jgi:magnesium and cobalt transporter
MDDSSMGPRHQPGSDPAGDGAQSDPSDDSPSLVAQLFRKAFGAEGDDSSESGLNRLDELAGTADQRAMLRNVYSLSEKRIDDVMVPRADIIAAEAEAGLSDVLALFAQSGHTRLPVYRDNLDDPIGFVHLKDVALQYGFPEFAGGDNFDLSRLARRALFVPPSMSADALLRRMQAARVHMALVIDEFGGVDGLVTIEDLVELIVGDIEDEHDAEEEATWREVSPGAYICSARADIAEFKTATGVTLVTDDVEDAVDTLGGLVFMLANRVPERGEVISHPNGYEFEVVEADPRRIKRLRVNLNGRAAKAMREAAE